MKNVVSNSWSRRGVGLSLLMAAALVLAPVSAYATTEKDEPAALASTQSTSAVLTQATVTTGTSDVATTPDTATTPTTPDATTPDTPTTPDATTPDTATTPDATTPDEATTPDADATTPTTPDKATTPDATTADKATTSEKATTPDKATTQATTTEATTVTTQAYRDQWVQEGSRWYYYDASGSRASGWVVNSTFKTYGLQRYWLDTTTKALASSELVKASEAGYWAYATRYGYVVRGRYTEGGVTYLADNDGRLESPGWHVSSAYGQGLQRYYVDSTKHGCTDGYSADGYAHYTTSAGYVLRGHLTSGTVTYLADNDGRLATSEGWHVSSAYGQGLQRYYVTAAKHGCVTGYSTAGWAHYTTPAGYVLRGAATCADGARRIADNDGRVQASGWLVTSAFGQGLQRYWLSGGSVAASRLVSPSEGAGYWAYATSAGYVLRGHLTSGTVTYLADNDGRLATSEGWHVSSAYGQGLQRYYVTAAKHGCVTGYSAAGWAHYTTSAGYVLRGHLTSGTVTYLADNDGRLATSEGWHVSSAYGQGLQRYYVTAAKHGCVTGYSAAGWAHYTTPAGYVARGAYDTGAGRVYVANNDGRLAWGTRTGWVVQNYGSGLQRYYVSASDHGACSGFFSVAGYGRCFGVGGAGYVMRGKMGWGSTVLLADNEGKLATQSGWLVTGAYDGGTPQRYYMVNAWSDYKGARTGWFTVSGSNFYGTGSGYVLRNSRFIRDGYVTVADNDGKVARATLSGNDDLDRKLANIIANSTGFSLWNCYSYVRDSFSYTVENEYPGGSWQSWSIPYAIEMINNRSGNCYRWASVMCWLARACGYDAHAVSGQVLGSSGWAAHGWTEINEGGSSYLYDPEMAHFHPGYSFYRTTLDGAPLYYRHI